MQHQYLQRHQTPHLHLRLLYVEAYFHKWKRSNTRYPTPPVNLAEILDLPDDSLGGEPCQFTNNVVLGIGEQKQNEQEHRIKEGC